LGTCLKESKREEQQQKFVFHKAVRSSLKDKIFLMMC
jgi:hypothetical protein